MVGALSSEHGNNMANKLELANNMANMTKSNLDNIVGSLWQARQESSGSSRGDQVIKHLSWCFVGRALLPRIKVLALFPSPALTADQPEHGKWSRTDLKTPPQQLVPRAPQAHVNPRNQNFAKSEENQRESLRAGQWRGKWGDLDLRAITTFRGPDIQWVAGNPPKLAPASTLTITAPGLIARKSAQIHRETI